MSKGRFDVFGESVPVEYETDGKRGEFTLLSDAPPKVSALLWLGDFDGRGTIVDCEQQLAYQIKVTSVLDGSKAVFAVLQDASRQR